MITLNAEKDNRGVFKSKLFYVPCSPLAEANRLEFGWVSLHLVDIESL